MKKLRSIITIFILLISVDCFAVKKKCGKKKQTQQNPRTKQQNPFASLQRYVLRGDVAKVANLFQQQKPDQATLNEALFMASGAFGSLPMVQFLIEQGADVNYQDAEGWSPLMEAADEGRNGIVAYLLSRDADISLKNAKGESALYRALGYDHGPVIRLLMQAGATL